jgi:hypothetical protein
MMKPAAIVVVCLALATVVEARRSVPSTSTPAGKVPPFSDHNIPYRKSGLSLYATV